MRYVPFTKMVHCTILPAVHRAASLTGYAYCMTPPHVYQKFAVFA